MPIVKLKDLEINKEGSYLVYHLIPAHDLTVVWGKPKTGKTFWVLDLAMHVAAGMAYRGKEVLSGPVVYCTLEGSYEFGARAHAARRALDLDKADVPFYASYDRRIFTKVGGSDGLIKDIGDTLSAPPVLTVIDTLNRSLDGSENSDEDMTHYTRCAENISNAFKCATIIIHHGGKSSDTPRGHTALTGTCAAQLKIERAGVASQTSPMMISTLVEFVKDGPEGEQLFSWIRPCTMGVNKRGKQIETCYIEEAPAPAFGMADTMISPQAKKALSVLQELMLENDSSRIKLQDWRIRCDLIPLSKKGTGAKQAFWRALDILRKNGIVDITDNIWVSIIKKKHDADNVVNFPGGPAS